MKSATFISVSTAVLTAASIALIPVRAASGVRVSASDASEFPEHLAALVAATSDFFDEVEAASRPAIPTIRIDGGKARAINISTRSNEARSLSADHGPVAGLTGYRINWYPVDRFLGAVDFMGVYGEGDLVCGYLTWDLTDPTMPSLQGVTADFVPVEGLSGLPETEVEVRLIEANCAHGTVEANLAYLDVTH